MLTQDKLQLQTMSTRMLCNQIVKFDSKCWNGNFEWLLRLENCEKNKFSFTSCFVWFGSDWFDIERKPVLIKKYPQLSVLPKPKWLLLNLTNQVLIDHKFKSIWWSAFMIVNRKISINTVEAAQCDHNKPWLSKWAPFKCDHNKRLITLTSDYIKRL